MTARISRLARSVAHGRRAALGFASATLTAALTAALVASCGGGGGDGGVTGTSTASVATVTLAPSAVTVDVGGSATLQAQALDGSGHVLADRPIVWTSSDAGIVAVGSDGRVTGVAAGTAEVAANAEGKFAKATVTVAARAVATVQIAPDAPRLVVGGRQQLTARTLYSDGSELPGRTVAWTTSDPRVVSVDGSGMLTATGAGVATVTATSEGRTASVAVTVQSVPVASVSVTPALDTLVVGQSTEMIATARDATGTALGGRQATWTAGDPGIVSVSSTGIVVALAAGATTVQATVDGVAGQARVVVVARPVGAVIVSPATSHLLVGQSVQLTTQITDANGTLLTGRTLAYAASDAAVATVDANGLVTARGSGTTTITASSEGRTGTATIEVALTPIATLEVQPAGPTVFVGGVVQLQAIARDSAGTVLTGRAVTWTTGAPSVASVTPTGRVTGLGAGTAVIIASAEGKLAPVTVTVRPVPVAAVRITPAGGSIAVGGGLDLVATPVDASGNTLQGRVVTFASSNEAVAVVSSSGHVTGIASGSAQIIATSEGVEGRVTVTVTPIPVASVSVSGAPATLFPGNTAQLTATARSSTGATLTGRAVTWSTSDASVATVSAAGVLTAVGPGSATITADVEGVKGTAGVTVTPVPVATVAVSLAPPSITVGTTSQATAVARDASGNVLTGRAVTWATSNASVATVSASGVVTGVAAGSATITGTSEGKSGTATIAVTPPPVATVTVTLGASTLTPGQSTTASAVVRDASGAFISGASVTWSTSDASIATVSATGTVTAAGVGTVAIRATSGGVTGSATLTVSPLPVATVTVSLAPPSITVGQTSQATAVARDGQGVVLTGRAVTWSTSNASVATVSPSGIVTGIAAGTATITANSDGKTGSATIAVSPVPVASVTVTLGTSSITAGQTTQAAAVARDAQGNVLSGVAITWSTADGSIATVGGAGLVTAVAPGSVAIRATAGGVTGSATLTVTAVPVSTVAVTLGSSALTVGGTTQATAVARDAQGNVLTGRAVTWSTSNASVATVSAGGVVTAVAPGTATITATSEGRSGGATVAVSPIPIGSVTVTLGSSTLTPGQTTQGSAVVRDAQGNLVSGATVAWSTSDASIATVSANGTVTAVAAGTAAIRATSGGITGSAVVTVSPAPVATVSVTLGTSTLTTGGTTQATAIARDAQGNVVTGVAVTWTSTATGVATVSGTGLVTAVGAGTASIQATAGGHTGSATVTVTAPPPTVATVTVSLAAPFIVIGGTTQATAVARDAQGNVVTGVPVTWSTSNANVATVSTSGVVTGVAVGNSTITATAGGKSGSAGIGVATPGPGPAATISVTLADASIKSNQKTTATAVVRDAAGTVLPNAPITWSTANTSVATVNATGNVAGVAAGATNVIATSGSASGSAALTVTPQHVVAVQVALGSSTLTTGQSTQASADLFDDTGTRLTGRAVTWSSSDASVATVNATGSVNAVAPGTTTITATSEGTSGAAPLTVAPPPVATVQVALGATSLATTLTTQATATLRDASGNVLTGRALTWSSSNTAVATVSASGVVTALVPGTTQITATSEGKSGSAALTVTLVPVGSVTVTLADASLQAGQTTQATATTRTAGGIVVTGRTIAWSTSNAAVATVSSSGVVTAVGAGSATITATSEGKSGGAAVTVTGVVVARVAVAPSTVNLDLSSKRTMTVGAVALDPSGGVIANAPLTWSTSDPRIATVTPGPNGTAVVTAIKEGDATLIVTSGSASDTAKIKVKE